MTFPIVPDKYRVLVDFQTNFIVQTGCRDKEWEALLGELDRSYWPEWVKLNIIVYKIKAMIAETQYAERV